ncbi:MarR family winged helix-turn-helix transcriptional regulator [Lacinutrix sp. Bg11-31]|uniref:MarR family winged helix-turn-helix transcriptional regulator n=1 Tax=Lacinutrix sp. Bg11-31 TaxID=2057808 RepID=UPI000C3025F2|nr:MarR family transcriptional regulator [Lacinutrix sp. Bg11-31]AUC81273.1 MarR family transcriptional regulator [Lacinutrix sp. Bg11-31]
MGDISKEIESTFPSNDLKAYINILYTASWVNGKQLEFFKPYNISPQQYNILRILRGAKEPISVQTVKNRMVQRSPNVTRLMDKLCAKELIDRIPSKHDRRVVNIIIIKNGLKLLAKIDDKWDPKLLKNLSEEEAGQLSDLLDKIR